MLVMAYPSLKAGPKLPPIQARPSRRHHLYCPLEAFAHAHDAEDRRNLWHLISYFHHVMYEQTLIPFPPRDTNETPGTYAQFPRYGEMMQRKRGTSRWKTHRQIVLMSETDGTATGGRIARPGEAAYWPLMATAT
jgi:hypothetical protein